MAKASMCLESGHTLQCEIGTATVSEVRNGFVIVDIAGKRLELADDCIDCESWTFEMQFAQPTN